MKKLITLFTLLTVLNIKAVPTFDFTYINNLDNTIVVGITFDANMFAVVERSTDGGITWIFLNSYGFQTFSYSYEFQYSLALAPSTMFRLVQF